MAISKARSQFNYIPYGGTCIVNQRNSASGITTINTLPGAYFDDVTQTNNAHKTSPSWANGTGVNVGSTGVMVFWAQSAGFGLDSVILANRGSATAYIGYNSTSPNIASGLTLATGESMKFENTNLHAIWAITSAGNTSITAQGLPKYTLTGR